MRRKKITEERILQITNNISEDEDAPMTVAELRECVRYWAMEHCKLVSEFSVHRSRMTINLLKLAEGAMKPLK